MYQVSDEQWDEIFLLVDARAMSLADMEALDRWASGLGRPGQIVGPATVISWLRTLPVKGDSSPALRPRPTGS